ncbi:MAG: NAD(P)/FAD-dependent oxidoreductase [Candidatus Buchananbacteria bacterium]|nr:NAD(P)/FAD-dependent oxidoreductase [Candidatus Buchananbacteria bacterium]
MLENNHYDAVIIGGGHNGLVCAAYLAKHGLKVIVLEQRHILGGACITEEIAGCKVSRASYVYSLFSPKVVSDLGLIANGLEILERDPPSFTPMLDGRYLILHQDMKRSQAAIAKFSNSDAQAYPVYEAMLDRIVRFIEPILHRTPPDFNNKRDWFKLLQLGFDTLKLKKDLPVLAELFSLSAYDFVTKYFESEPLISTLCTDGIIGSIGGPMTAGTAYVLLHHVMGEVNGHRGRWGYVRGGMGGLTEAILKTFIVHGGQYLTQADVAKILIRNSRAVGVVLKDGRIINSKIVISSADPHNTFSVMIDPKELPNDFETAVNKINYASATSKINLVIDGYLQFHCYAGIVSGTFHIGETSKEMEKAADDAKYGRISDNLILEGCVPSVVDNTLAPVGRHIISLLVQYTPYKLADGVWSDRKSELLLKTIDRLALYTNINKLGILAADVLTPTDLENDFRLTGGNLFHGLMNPSQLFSFRPVSGFADYRTPIAGLYLCGSGTHPGGGITGIPGHNAAKEIIRDKKWFKK